MSWSEAMLALLVSHVAGDVLLQTEWQAQTKARGVGDAAGRQALARHPTTYMLAFLPALAWIGAETNILRAVVVGALVASTHLVSAWLRRVKRAANPAPTLSIAVDQSLHVLSLLGAAPVAAI